MHIFLKPPSLIKCPKCGKPTRPHTVCLNCGYYKGMEVIDVFKKLSKKERKEKEKEIKEFEEEKSQNQPSLSWEGLSKK